MDGHEASATIWDHLRTVVRHRWWALAGFALLAVPVLLVTLYSTPVFRAETRLLVGQGPQNPEVGAANKAPRDEKGTVIDAQTLTQMVRNRALAREVIERQTLWKSPEFAGYVATASTDEERALGLVDPFLGRLTATIVPDSQMMVVAFESNDAALAAHAVNDVATRFIERDRESRFAAANAGAGWLTNRLAEQRQQVAAAETALQAYRANQDAMSLSDRQNIVGQKLTDLNASVTQANTERLAREAQYQLLQSIKNDPNAVEGFPAVAANTQVQALKLQVGQLSRQDAELADRLGPKHPDRIQVASALEAVRKSGCGPK